MSLLEPEYKAEYKEVSIMWSHLPSLLFFLLLCFCLAFIKSQTCLCRFVGAGICSNFISSSKFPFKFNEPLFGRKQIWNEDFS